MEWVSDHLLKPIDASINEAETPLSALRAVFMSHINFVATYPGVPRMMFGEMQHSENTAPRQRACSIVKKYGDRIILLIEQGKQEGQIDPKVDSQAARTLFIGSIQGLVMQSILTGEMKNITEKASDVFAIYRRGIENTQ